MKKVKINGFEQRFTLKLHFVDNKVKAHIFEPNR